MFIILCSFASQGLLLSYIICSCKQEDIYFIYTLLCSSGVTAKTLSILSVWVPGKLCFCYPTYRIDPLVLRTTTKQRQRERAEQGGTKRHTHTRPTCPPTRLYVWLTVYLARAMISCLSAFDFLLIIWLIESNEIIIAHYMMGCLYIILLAVSWNSKGTFSPPARMRLLFIIVSYTVYSIVLCVWR
jgi:hypothetical protein